MDAHRIAELLQPFLGLANDGSANDGSANDQRLTANDLLNISTYIDLLIRWNARINLTAIRAEEEIVTRHFGESLFAARHLFPRVARAPSPAKIRLIDIGSGAGFPGLPIKIWAPEIDLTLIESNQKKATFLREVARKLTLTDINVFSGRAEDFPNPPVEVVTLRAVEHFGSILPIAARLVAPAGRLALLIGHAQLTQSQDLTPTFTWRPALPVPLSASRVLVIGIRNQEPHAPD